MAFLRSFRAVDPENMDWTALSRSSAGAAARGAATAGLGFPFAGLPGALPDGFPGDEADAGFVVPSKSVLFAFSLNGLTGVLPGGGFAYPGDDADPALLLPVAAGAASPVAIGRADADADADGADFGAAWSFAAA